MNQCSIFCPNQLCKLYIVREMMHTQAAEKTGYCSSSQLLHRLMTNTSSDAGLFTK